MIISKAPLRLTLGGGGTDLECYSGRYGGFLVTSALDKYVYVLVKDRFEPEIRASYSITEICRNVSDIKHCVIREALKLLGLKDHLEIVSSADMPSETGLGSSGSFTVSLLQALHGQRGEHPSHETLAVEATDLVINVLKELSGPQDTYIASYGGFICMEVAPEGKVTVSRLKISPNIIRELENNLLFFYTGFKRSALTVLKDQASNILNSHATLQSMHRIKEIGFSVKNALEHGDLAEFGRLQHEHWLAKQKTSLSICNDHIAHWYKLGLRNGAIGGKLMGAGGGGFLMFYCENGKDCIRKAMSKEGLEEVRFRFSSEGSKVMIDI